MLHRWKVIKTSLNIRLLPTVTICCFERTIQMLYISLWCKYILIYTVFDEKPRNWFQYLKLFAFLKFATLVRSVGKTSVIKHQLNRFCILLQDGITFGDIRCFIFINVASRQAYSYFIPHNVTTFDIPALWKTKAISIFNERFFTTCFNKITQKRRKSFYLLSNNVSISKKSTMP